MKKLWLILAIAMSSAFAADVKLDDGPNGPPPAATLSGLASEMQADVSALPALNATLAAAATDNANARKEGAVYLADQKQKLAALEAAIKWQLDNVLGPVNRAWEEAVAEYSARCAGKSLPRPQYDACVSDKNVLDARHARESAWWEDYKIKWNAANTAPVNAVIIKQNARLAVLNEIIQRTAKEYNEATAKSIALRTRIAEIEAIFRRSCSSTPGSTGSFTKQEALKYCNSIKWDGASANLPPLYTWQGTGSQ